MLLHLPWIVLNNSHGNVLRWILSGPVRQSLQVDAELSLAHGLVRRRNLWLLVVPSMSYMIPMSWLSLFLPALSLQPILFHWSCTLLNPRISESPCFLEYLLRMGTPSLCHSPSSLFPCPNPGFHLWEKSGHRTPEETQSLHSFPSILWIIIFLRPDFQREP